jgi:hypothetical protein
MVEISFYKKGTKVYYFDSMDFTLKETIVLDVKITVPDVDPPSVIYTLDMAKGANIKLPSTRVFDDRDKLKDLVLQNFKETKSNVVGDVS